jgi:hypothetical protein
MRLPTLLMISAILGICLGLAFFILPAQVMSIFGVSAGIAHQHMARNFASATLALGLLAWFVRETSNRETLRAVVFAFLCYFLLGSISILHFQLTGEANAYGWPMFILHVFLGSAYGYNFHKLRNEQNA